MKKIEQAKLDLNGVAFRWGGMLHEFEKTAGEWSEEYKEFNSQDCENPFERCWICGRKLARKKPVYVGNFFENDHSTRFRIICCKCAYSLGRQVIESDGKDYWTFEDFKNKKGN